MNADASRPPRVLVVDNPMTRAGMRIALNGTAVVCGEADDVVAAVAIARREQPDVCLIGLDVGGGEAIARVRNAAPGIAVVAMARDTDSVELLAAIRAGAAGYVPAEIDGDALCRVVLAACAGEAAVPRELVADLIQEIRIVAGARRAGLTIRESQVLGMLRRGSSTKQIAAQLRISPVTVRRHASAVVRKVGVSDRSALAPDVQQTPF